MWWPSGYLEQGAEPNGSGHVVNSVLCASARHGNGGTSRLLIDYPPAQRNEILNYLFGPGGADLQVLKIEIAGDAAQSDGAEPAVEHTKGHIDCNSGYGLWLAEQAVARNPNITLMALQWSAKSHHLKISYIGGWNEHGYIKSWYEALRGALNANGFASIKIIAADSFPGRHYIPARTWNVAAAAAIDPKFKAVLSAYGSHDTCGEPTRGYVCESTSVARHSGLPLWESELGTLHGPTSPVSLVIADQPQSSNYTVKPIEVGRADQPIQSPGQRPEALRRLRVRPARQWRLATAAQCPQGGRDCTGVGHCAWRHHGHLADDLARRERQPWASWSSSPFPGC